MKLLMSVAGLLVGIVLSVASCAGRNANTASRIHITDTGSPTEILGTWRFTNLLGTHEWTFAYIGTTNEGFSVAEGFSSAEGVGVAEPRYLAIGGRLHDIRPKAKLNYEYMVFWSSATDSLCHRYLFDLTSATTAHGVYAPGLLIGASCGDAINHYPATGVRISTSQ